jgi:hypothetical protein
VKYPSVLVAVPCAIATAVSIGDSALRSTF